MISEDVMQRLREAAPKMLAAQLQAPSPGPWRVSDENCGGGANVVDKDGNRVLHTAIVWRGAEIIGGERALANARIAAAAPTMLDVLRILATATGVEYSPEEYQRQVQEMASEAIAGL
jgi:hypothetical protein